MKQRTGSLGFLRECVRKDVRRRLADPASLLLWIGIPAVIGSLLAMVTGGGGGPRAHLLVADNDDSFLSRALIAAAAQGPAAEFLQVQSVSPQEGRERLDAGDGSALLLIPKGFARAVIDREATELTLVTNPAQRILPAIIEQGAEMLVEVIFYAQRLFAEAWAPISEALETDADAGPTLDQVNAVSSAIYERIEALEPLLFPPALKLVSEEQEGEGAGGTGEESEAGAFDMARLFLPAMLFMSVLFVAQGVSDDLWYEIDNGTLRRVLASRHGAGVLLAGKLAATAAVVAVVAAVGLAIAFLLLSVPASRLVPALLWCTYAGAAFVAYFLALQSLATSRRGGSVLSSMILFPLLMAGGSFFPFAVMPEWMAAIGRRTPNGMALLQFEAILFGRSEPLALVRTGAAIGLAAAAAVALCAARARRLARAGG